MKGEQPPEIISGREGLVAFWDFREDAGKARISLEGHQLALQETNGSIERVDTGIFGPYSARIRHGQWFMIKRKDIGPLNIYGKDAQVSVIAWIKRETTSIWQTIAGVWDETRSKRQYCLFLNASRGTDAGEMKRYRISNRIHGHVSAVGGPTPGNKVCITYSSGATEIPLNEWHCIAMTYDGITSRVYIDGRLDAWERYNPFPYPDGLFDGGEDGADFTVGAVNRYGSWGNFYGGLIGGLAIYRRALSAEELKDISKNVKLPK